MVQVQEGQFLTSGDDSAASLAFVAHELKVPLANLRYFANLLLDSKSNLSPEQRATYLARMQFTAERSLNMVQGLAASLRGNQLELELEPLNIAHAVEDILHDISPLAHELGQSFNFKYPRQPVLALANRQYFKTTVTNLCDNALHHNPAGEPVRLAVSQPAKFIQLQISDHGPRVSAADFRQLKSKLGEELYPISSRMGSSGLGLFIASRLTQAMGGQLQLIRHHKAGISFGVRLQPSAQLNLF